MKLSISFKNNGNRQRKTNINVNASIDNDVSMVEGRAYDGLGDGDELNFR